MCIATAPLFDSIKLRRSGMFIAREPKQDRPKPHGGGMVARGGTCRSYGA